MVALEKFLESHDLTSRTVGRNYFSNQQPLFLQMLSERIDPGDACSQQLARLAWEVELHGVA